MNTALNRYSRIIERIFLLRYQDGLREIAFTRSDIETAAAELQIALPKNIGDLVYSFRFRTTMPASLQATAPQGEMWLIELAGRGQYRFVLKSEQQVSILPNRLMTVIKVPDATPGIVAMYALSDEQALLARLRYNRLVDLFTGITCYSLQNHLRTTTTAHGQVDTDELYIGVDKRGIHYALPIQAKGGRDRLGIVQVEQDRALCAEKYPSLICKPIGAQFMSEDVIALFEFDVSATEVTIATERHYRLVPPEQLSPEDLATYRRTFT